LNVTALPGSLTQGLLSGHTEMAPVYNVMCFISRGINNLHGPAVDSLAELFGLAPELLEECKPQMTEYALQIP
jgi:hypothetical protein